MALIVGGLVGFPVMIAVSDDTVVGELIKVKETALDDEGSIVDESVGESNSEATVEDVIDTSGVVVIVVDTDAEYEGLAAELVEGTAVEDILDDEEVEKEPDNDASDEIEANNDILEVSEGLFEEENNEEAEVETTAEEVVLTVGGMVGSSVGEVVLNDTVVDEIKHVDETKLDNEGNTEAESEESNVSVKSGVGEFTLDDETEDEINKEFEAELLKDIVYDDSDVAVNKSVKDSKGDEVIDGVAKFDKEIIADDDSDIVANSVIVGEFVPKSLNDINDLVDGLPVAIGVFDTESKFELDTCAD